MLVKALGVALVLVMAAGCGGGADPELGASPEVEDVTVIVHNDFGSTLAVSIIFGAGATERRLGQVSAGKEGQFTVPWTGAGFATVVESVLDNRRAASNTMNIPPGGIIYVEVDPNFRQNVRAYDVKKD